MFTGLIETTGTIEKLTSRGDYTVMTIASSFPHDELVIGESISCDGACLTVIEKAIGGFVVEASHETTARTVLSQYRVGARLNLERALKVGSRLGGHFVSGHVDTVGVVDYIKLVGESIELAVRFDSEFDAWVIEKGSIAINGVSLTINRTSSGWLSVNIIPHTASHTGLVGLGGSASVNLEFDLIGKYISKQKQVGSADLSIDTLINSGW